MFQSSAEYLNALRDGRYLQFLDWPNFIRDLYKSNEVLLGADEVNDFLFFEWIKTGYCEEDVRCFALFCALNIQYPDLIPGKLASSLVALYGALIQCMVFESNQSQGRRLFNKNLSVKEILSWVRHTAFSLKGDDYNKALETQQSRLVIVIEEVKRSDLIELHDQIDPIMKIQKTLDNYLNQFESNRSKQDTVFNDRVSLIRGLLSYVESISVLSEESLGKIQFYIKCIKERQPAQWEEAFLDRISPPSLLDISFKTMISLGYSLFNLLDDSSSGTHQDVSLKK